MDGIALRLYLCRVEERLLSYATEARRTRDDLDLGLVDEDMALRRAGVLTGLGEHRRDDLRILLPRTRLGRLCYRLARGLARAARAVG